MGPCLTGPFRRTCGTLLSFPTKANLHCARTVSSPGPDLQGALDTRRARVEGVWALEVAHPPLVPAHGPSVEAPSTLYLPASNTPSAYSLVSGYLAPWSLFQYWDTSNGGDTRGVYEVTCWAGPGPGATPTDVFAEDPAFLLGASPHTAWQAACPLSASLLSPLGFLFIDFFSFFY